MKVSVQAAAAKLPDLIDAARSGEEVLLSSGDEPVARIVAVEAKKFQIGLMQGQLGRGPDFFEPMSQQDLAAWEGAN